MRPPLIQDGQTGQRDRGLKSTNFRILPAGGLQAKVTEDSPSIAEMFTHIHFVRLVFVFEDAPGVASQKQLPETEWVLELDSDRIAGMLVESAEAVREAVQSRLEQGRNLDVHYDHPILLLQHMIWHEGYHHGQIKLAIRTVKMPDSSIVGVLATIIT